MGQYYKDRETAEVIQADLRSVGIDAVVDTAEWGAYLGALLEATHDYHLFMLGWSTINTDADAALMQMLHSSARPPNGFNYVMYADEELDAWLEEARATTDPSAREQIYLQVQEQLLEDAVWIPLFNTLEVVVTSKNVQGFKVHPVDYYLWMSSVRLSD